MKIKQLKVHSRPVCELCGQPNRATKMPMHTKDENPILQKVPPVVREVRRQNEGEDCEHFGPRSDILNSSMQFLRLRSQNQTIVEEKLQLGFFNLHVHGQQIAQINVLAGHDLKNKFHRNWGNAGSNNKRLISHDRSRSWRHARHSHVTVSEMAANAGAVKVGTNDSTITEKVETGLPADG